MPFRINLPKYAALLICLFLLIAIFPLLPLSVPSYSLEFAYDAVLVTGLLPALRMAQYRTALLTLTIATIAFRWAGHFIGDTDLILLAASLLTIFWLGSVSHVIMIDLMKKTAINFDKVAGAIVVYLFIAFIFSEVYTIIQLYDQSSFNNLRPGREALSMLYFSMSSMAGKDFGAIGVNSDVIIAFSLIQSMLGMFFVAVLVAWLVGLNIA
ncbi:MAG: hypothetical protein ACR2PI_24515, partial [Hyphomicrobiaceae bacterium]